MYYIRKLSNQSNLYKLRTAKNTASMDADILKQELGTAGNTLSFWKCDNCDNSEGLKNAIKAILLSTTAIKASQFIVIQDAVAEKYGLSVDDTEVGITGYRGYENLHINVVELTYEKIGTILDMLHEVVGNAEYTPKLEKAEVKSYIREVREAGLLNESAINEDLMEDINKYFSNLSSR